MTIRPAVVVRGFQGVPLLRVEEALAHALAAGSGDVAATDLRQSAKLLREVNDHNVSIRGARVLLTDDGLLIVAGEIRAESLEPGELGALVRIVAECAEQVGELVQLLYGSSSAAPETSEVQP